MTEHPRSLHKGTEHLVLDHYLEILARKPGALAGATALAAARASGAFTRRALGDGPGTRALIGALLLHRTMPGAAVLAGMAAAIELGRHDPDIVAVEARRHLTAPTTEPAVVMPAALSTSLPPARPRRHRPRSTIAARLRRTPARDREGHRMTATKNTASTSAGQTAPARPSVTALRLANPLSTHAKVRS